MLKIRFHFFINWIHFILLQTIHASQWLDRSIPKTKLLKIEYIYIIDLIVSTCNKRVTPREAWSWIYYSAIGYVLLSVASRLSILWIYLKYPNIVRTPMFAQNNAAIIIFLNIIRTSELGPFSDLFSVWNFGKHLESTSISVHDLIILKFLIVKISPFHGLGSETNLRYILNKFQIIIKYDHLKTYMFAKCLRLY